LALDDDTSGAMMHHIPSITGMAISVPLQLLLLAAWGMGFFSDLRRDCRKGPVVAALLTGVAAGILVRLVILLATDDGTYGALCRSNYNSNLPNTFWIIADLIERGLLGFGGLGLTLAWLVVRYSVRGIRPDKTTMIIGGALAGLAVGAAVEYSQIHWGSLRAANPPRIVLFALLGGFLSIVSRPFLFRKGRFQFGIKNLFALTVVWALIFDWLGPQWSRYQAENDAMASLATLLGGPVQCSRTEGLVGLAYVDTIHLPPCKIADAQVDAVIAQLRRLPRLYLVDAELDTTSAQGLKRLKEALPGVTFGKCSSMHDNTEEILPDAAHPRRPPAPNHHVAENRESR
jgi:hypothetical protein